jgi:hypothetical protein
MKTQSYYFPATGQLIKLPATNGIDTGFKKPIHNTLEEFNKFGWTCWEIQVFVYNDQEYLITRTSREYSQPNHFYLYKMNFEESGSNASLLFDSDFDGKFGTSKGFMQEGEDYFITVISLRMDPGLLVKINLRTVDVQQVNVAGYSSYNSVFGNLGNNRMLLFGDAGTSLVNSKTLQVIQTVTESIGFKSIYYAHTNPNSNAQNKFIGFSDPGVSMVDILNETPKITLTLTVNLDSLAMAELIGVPQTEFVMIGGGLSHLYMFNPAAQSDGEPLEILADVNFRELDSWSLDFQYWVPSWTNTQVPTHFYLPFKTQNPENSKQGYFTMGRVSICGGVGCKICKPDLSDCEDCVDDITLIPDPLSDDHVCLYNCKDPVLERISLPNKRCINCLTERELDLTECYFTHDFTIKEVKGGPLKNMNASHTFRLAFPNSTNIINKIKNYINLRSAIEVIQSLYNQFSRQKSKAKNPNISTSPTAEGTTL